MLSIRFLRLGKKSQPFFRLVVTDKRNPPKGGRFLESLGFYNPLTKEKKLNGERIKHWLSVGAKPSGSVHNLLISEGIIEGKKIPVHKKAKSASTPAKDLSGKEAVADKKQEKLAEPKIEPKT